MCFGGSGFFYEIFPGHPRQESTPQREHIFIHIKLGVVLGGGDSLLFIPDSQEEEGSRNFLKIEAHIFGGSWWGG